MREKQEQEEVLTLDETAAFLKLHRRTVESMLLKGRLPGKKLGRQWRILKSELISFLRTSENIPSPRSKRKGGE